MDKYLNSPSENTFHVAIIMDGNGRWATRQGKPRFYGHQAGAAQLRKIVESAPELHIDVLTVYAFSSDNWRRPKYEVNFLMDLFNSYLKSEVAKCQENGIRLSIIGRRDRLQPKIVELIEHAEKETVGGKNLHLRVAVDYSSKEMILQAAIRLSQEKDISQQTFSNLLANGVYPWEPSPNVDLLIRTGGEQRLSDFLLWECAYAELFFTPVMWPEFSKKDLQTALRKFQLRERRFGQVPEVSAI